MDGIEDGGGIHPSSVRDELGAAGMDLGELGQVVGLPVEARRATRGEKKYGALGKLQRGHLVATQKAGLTRLTNPTYYHFPNWPNWLNWGCKIIGVNHQVLA